MLTNSQAQPRTEVRRKQKDPEKHAARGLIAGGRWEEKLFRVFLLPPDFHNDTVPVF